MADGGIAFGIAGWSYDDWRGVVYPRGCKDTLRHCARLVDCIEINSSFYQVPVAHNCARWVERTADLDVFFTAKLPQDFTHRGRLTDALVAATCEGFAPLREAGVLRALLAQFSHRFAASPKSRRYLADLVARFRGLAPIVVEVRHGSWARPDALELLAELGVSACHLDYPGAASGGFACGRTGPDGLAYFRLHGRNAETWFARDAGRDAVYDWEYSRGELDEIAARVADIDAQAGHTIVIANNHFCGKAVKLTLELLARFRGGPVDVPEPMLAAFPSLGRIASRGQRGLFDPRPERDRGDIA